MLALVLLPNFTLGQLCNVHINSMNSFPDNIFSKSDILGHLFIGDMYCQIGWLDGFCHTGNQCEDIIKGYRTE